MFWDGIHLILGNKVKGRDDINKFAENVLPFITCLHLEKLGIIGSDGCYIQMNKEI